MSCMSVHVLPCTTVHEPVLGACPSALQTLSFGNCFGAPQCTYFTPQQGNQEPQHEIALPFMQNTSYSWACELPQPLQSPCMTRFMLHQQETQRSPCFHSSQVSETTCRLTHNPIAVLLARKHLPGHQHLLYTLCQAVTNAVLQTQALAIRSASAQLMATTQADRVAGNIHCSRCARTQCIATASKPTAVAVLWFAV